MADTSTIKRRRGRPAKAQAGFSETKYILLRSGMEILTEKGYCATGIDEILRQVGVPKGSFYHYFKSKEVFGIALIHNYSNFFKHKLNKFLSDKSLSPLERLIGFIEDAIQSMTRYNFRRGCLVGNLGQEMSALPESFRDEIKIVFNEWQDLIEQCLEEAKTAGQISVEVDCRQSAYIFWIGWEGAVLRAKLERQADPLNLFSSFFLSSLK